MKPEQNPEFFDGTHLPKIATLQAMGIFNNKIRGILDNLGELSGSIQQILDEIRSKVYFRGLAGGPETLHETATTHAKKVNAISGKEQPPTREEIRMWRSYIALLALANLQDSSIEKHIGNATGSLRVPSPKRALSRFFTEDGKIKRLIREQTSLMDLLDLIALTEDYSQAPFEDKSQMKLARQGALESFTRRVITGDRHLLDVCVKYLNINICKAIVASVPGVLGEGKIGGKAAGMLVAYAILETESPDFDTKFAQEHNLSEQELKTMLEGVLHQNFSHFIGSEVIHDFLKHNEGILGECTVYKYSHANGTDPEQQATKYEDLKRRIVEEARFPQHIARQLHTLFKSLHGKPIIIRSSSELEDKYGAAFAGKYDSIYLPNTGDFNADKKEFFVAIRKVFASSFNPDAMEYRKKKGLLGEEEQMAILIQTVNGNQHGDYFYPGLAGVSMSHATQSFGPDPSKGAMKVVAGLGETAVDNQGGRFIMFDAPTASISGNKGETYQKQIVAINTKTGEKTTVSPYKLKQDNGLDPATLPHAFSVLNRGRIEEATRYNLGALTPFLTLNGLAEYSNLPLIIEYYTQKLKNALNYNVDIEFTTEFNQRTGKFEVYIVQCRPQNIPEEQKPSKIPTNIPEDHVILKTNDTLMCGQKENVRYIVYIPPEMAKGSDKTCLSSSGSTKFQAWVGKLNQQFGKNNYIIINPGRWASKDDYAGIPASFSNFSNAAACLEMVGKTPTMTQGYDPVPSFGSHCFQDYVEGGILTCGVSLSGENDGLINREILDAEENNCANELLPNLPEELKPWLRVIDMEKAGKRLTGQTKPWRLHIAMDNTKKDIRPAHIYMAEKDKDLPTQN